MGKEKNNKSNKFLISWGILFKFLLLVMFVTTMTQCLHASVRVYDRQMHGGYGNIPGPELQLGHVIKLPSENLENRYEITGIHQNFPENLLEFTDYVEASFSDFSGGTVPPWATGDNTRQMEIFKDIISYYDPTYTVQQDPEVRGGLAEGIFSFIHLGDVQLREANVKMISKKFVKWADKYVKTFMRNEDQEMHDIDVYYAIISTINHEVNAIQANGTSSIRPYPEFMIHAGDAVDTGVIEEWNQFVTITNKIKIPWLNSVGNHDILALGNLLLDGECTTIQEIVPDYYVPWLPKKLKYPKVCLNREVVYSDLDLPKKRRSFIGDVQPGEQYNNSIEKFIGKHLDEEQTIFRGSPTPIKTSNNGFDFNDNKGYYNFKHQFDFGSGDMRTVHFIVLMTASIGGGAAGIFDNLQKDWLSNILENDVGKKDIVIVFGHHPIGKFIYKEEGEELENLLYRSPNVVAYFTGHTHQHKITSHMPRTPGEHGFWEVITSAIIEYPQEARFITLKRLGQSNVAFIESITFGSELKREGNFYFEHLKKGMDGAHSDFINQGRERGKIRTGDPTKEYQKDTFARLFFKLPGD